MVTAVIGPAAVLFNDDPLRIPRATSYFRIHIVLVIVARGKAMFAIVKLTASDIAWQGVAMPGLELRQEVLRLLRRGCRGSRRFCCLRPFDEPGG